MILKKSHAAKIYSEAIYYSFKLHGNALADFDTVGEDIAKYVLQRFDSIEKNHEAVCQAYDQQLPLVSLNTVQFLDDDSFEQSTGYNRPVN